MKSLRADYFSDTSPEDFQVGGIWLLTRVDGRNRQVYFTPTGGRVPGYSVVNSGQELGFLALHDVARADLDFATDRNGTHFRILERHE